MLSQAAGIPASSTLHLISATHETTRLPMRMNYRNGHALSLVIRHTCFGYLN